MKHSTNLLNNSICDLVSSIYDAALDEKEWINVLTKMASALNAEQGCLRLLNTPPLEVFGTYNFNRDLSMLQDYMDYYVHIDPWVERLVKLEGTNMLCTHHLIPEKIYEQSEFYQGYAIQQDIHFGVGGIVNLTDEIDCYLTFQRGKKRVGFDQSALALLYQLVPHVRKAVLVNKKVKLAESESKTLRDALGQINSPLLLVNRDGRVVFINELAEQLIAHQTGVSIRNHRLTLKSSEKNSALCQLINGAVCNTTYDTPKTGGAMCYQTPDTQTILSILITPINQAKIDIGLRESGLALILLNTNKPQIEHSADMLSALYNLTPAEARLSSQLCQGLTLDEMANNLFLSKNTLRSQLRSCFNKTGTTRQSELISIINTGPAGIFHKSS